MRARRIHQAGFNLGDSSTFGPYWAARAASARTGSNAEGAATQKYFNPGLRAPNDTNSLTVAGGNLVDPGIRYAPNIRNGPATWRFGVDQVADRNFWSDVGASNLTGTAGSCVPRTVVAFVTLDL